MAVHDLEKLCVFSAAHHGKHEHGDREGVVQPESPTTEVDFLQILHVPRVHIQTELKPTRVRRLLVANRSLNKASRRRAYEREHSACLIRRHGAVAVSVEEPKDLQQARARRSAAAAAGAQFVQQSHTHGPEFCELSSVHALDAGVERSLE